jgi:DNA-directed DNA polymerase III PolC
MSFALPGCRSNFSLLWGTAFPEQLVGRAAELGLEHLGLADDDNLYGVVDFNHSCRAVGINPLIGVRLTTVFGRLHLIAQDYEGYRNLCRLVTFARLDGPVTESQLQTHGGHLIGLTATMNGANALRAIFGPDLFFSMTGKEDQRTLQALARSTIPPVADPTISFLDRNDYQLHLLLRAIDTGALIADLDGTPRDTPDCFFPDASDIGQRYRHAPEAIRNGLAMADRCRVVFPDHRNLLPSCPGTTSEKRIHLREKAMAGLLNKQGVIGGIYQSRLDFELTVIDRTGFTDYFLIVSGIIDHCHRADIPVVGRGSAAGSLVAFGLGITQVDPIGQGLYFERFLNEARSDPPDIDLDIDWRRRDDLLEYIYDQYGRDRTAMIATYTRFGARMAVREAAKAVGVTPEAIDRLAKRLPYGAAPGEIDRALEHLPEATRARTDIEHFRPVLQAATRLDNFPRHLGIHPGGVVITPTPLTDYVALERATKGIVVTQCDMYQAEKLGLVKIDILGQRGLAVIVDCQREVQRSQGGSFAVPDNDPPAYDLLRSGKTIGVFQIESPGLRALLRDLRPRQLNDITLALALIRPGASDSGMKKVFLDRFHGDIPTAYPHARLEKILEETFGVFVYQEQVLLCAREVAGFNLPAADLLRRAITKARHETDYANLYQRFLRGALENGLTREKALEIFELLRCFAGFGFCKAHAATYGYLAYQSAWFKMHHPALFMQAVLNNDGGYYPASVYIAEARRLGVKIIPPDVNHSNTLERLDGDRLYVGLGRVRDMEQKTIEQIIAWRPFGSFDDFLGRIRLSATEAENLVKVGGFDSIDPDRPRLLWRLRLAARRGPVGNAAVGETGVEPGDIFAGQLIVPTARRLPKLPPVTPFEQFRYELEILGFPATRHPLTLFPAYDGVTIAAHADKANGAAVRLCGWLVDVKRIKTREKKEPMVFITFEDPEDTFEVVLFPAVFKRYSELIREYRFMTIEGKINRDGGTIAVIADTLSPAPTGLEKNSFL